MPANFPAHAFEPPVADDDPQFQGVIDVLLHGFPSELEVLAEIEELATHSKESVNIRRTSIRDGALYVIIQIGLGIASNLITTLIKEIGSKAAERLKEQGKPVIYISPAYAPRKGLQVAGSGARDSRIFSSISFG